MIACSPCSRTYASAWAFQARPSARVYAAIRVSSWAISRAYAGGVGLVEVAVDIDEAAVPVEYTGHHLGDPALARAGLADQEHHGGRLLPDAARQEVGDDALTEDPPVLGVGQPVPRHLGRVDHAHVRLARTSRASRA